MDTKKYRTVLYFIVFTILVTITIQVYWNIQNYLTNKQRMVNQVQLCLDNSVEDYHANLAKTDFYAFLNDRKPPKRPKHRVKIIGTDTLLEFRVDSLKRPVEFIAFTSGRDSLRNPPKGFTTMELFRKRMRTEQGTLKELVNRLIISATTDSIDLAKLDSLFKNELNRKSIDLDHSLSYYRNDSLITTFNSDPTQKYPLHTYSKSTLLAGFQNIELSFSNPTLSILKKGLFGILLSLTLSLGIILCLYYLLHIIKRQKQLAEIKNDLISNITHEFKTPIATVSAALEGIKNFNKINDKARTEKYLDISNQQLQKLHQMVEKLLETATLDSDKLIINKESVDVVYLLKQLVDKYQIIAPKKAISFSTNASELPIEVDIFHFENALANLIDNALKYGGDKIEININSLLNSVEITIADDGGHIDPSQREKIFDKFYRIPTGNLHDVKGFGIGLFYTKKIVEKHDGSIQLVPTKRNTVFKITL